MERQVFPSFPPTPWTLVSLYTSPMEYSSKIHISNLNARSESGGLGLGAPPPKIRDAKKLLFWAALPEGAGNSVVLLAFSEP